MVTEPGVSALPPLPAHSVAVVGAGISGLIAARTLLDHGLEVKVFDKGRRPGGRASTRRHGEHAFDHGAQYFTAHDPRFARCVESWVDEGVVGRWGGRIAVVEDGRVGLKESDRERFVGIPGMSAVARHLASGLDVASGTRVERVERRDGRWRLTAGAGASLGDFDAVLAATPPAQAATLLAGAPDLARRAAAVEMRPCWAVMAAFGRELELAFDGAFVAGSPLSWIVRDGSKPGRSAGERWLLHGSPDWSSRHLEAEAGEVEQALLAAFFAAAGLEPLAPAFARAHRWRYSIAADPLDAGCLWDAGLAIGACGDWCCGSRIEGAFLSGTAAAGRVLGLPGRGEE